MYRMMTSSDPGAEPNIVATSHQNNGEIAGAVVASKVAKSFKN